MFVEPCLLQLVSNAIHPPRKIAHCAGLLEAALVDYSAVLAAEPTDVDALYQRGSAAHKLGQLEAAITDFSAVLSLDPNHAKAAYSRAACNNLAGRFDDANGACFAPWPTVQSNVRLHIVVVVRCGAILRFRAAR